MVVTIESRSSSRVLAYLQLLRLPNVFTAMADVALGFLLTHPTLSPLVEFVCLVISSSALYMAGMVLNDVLDRQQDGRERPERPIPSGRLSVSSAAGLSVALFGLGIVAALAVGMFAHHLGPLLVALALIVFIVSYDAHFKHAAGGPLAMGICRMLNVLLGMSTSIAPPSTANSVVVGGIGLYIAGVTWFAAREAGVSRRVHLAGAVVMILAGIGLAFSFPWQLAEASLAGWYSAPRWILLWCLVSVMIGWRFVIAVARPAPGQVQSAVKSGILLLIALDAVMVAPVRGPAATLGVLLLLLPAAVLGRWVYST